MKMITQKNNKHVMWMIFQKKIAWMPLNSFNLQIKTFQFYQKIPFKMMIKIYQKYSKKYVQILKIFFLLVFKIFGLHLNIILGSKNLLNHFLDLHQNIHY